MTTIIFASSNKGKFRELAKKLSGTKLELKSISEFIKDFNPEETGFSFHENAFIKAKAAINQLNSPLELDIKSTIPKTSLILSDDSGLEIGALEGRPGIYSGRYLKSPEGGIQGILREMEGKTNRKARFVCSMVLMKLSGELIFKTENYWNGKIADDAKGQNGFGYDPIIIPDEESEKTVAELDLELKNKISHRAKALEALTQFLYKF
jgi:XTP/dITP diphosphohydrolase